MKLLNNNHCVEQARYETVIFELECNYFNEWSYIVQDVLNDDSFQAFYIGTFLDYESQRVAYERAARHYNSLVPDSECIPLF